MTVKKSYNNGDSVWIYGISRNNARPVKGTVIKSFDLSDCGYNDELHYLVEIPTEIEPLLEVRTWHNISQDEKGPVGSLRELGVFIEPTIKFASRLGFVTDDEYEPGDPTPEEIQAAIDKSIKDINHAPLNLKTEKPKRRYFKKKKA
jgi:hypothetical protein